MPRVQNLPGHVDLWFQQDSATAHMARISMAALHNLFPQLMISHSGDVPWLPHSPDLNAPDIFLWGNLQGKVHSTWPADLDDLK
jgi:hypothetical protein